MSDLRDIYFSQIEAEPSGPGPTGAADGMAAVAPQVSSTAPALPIPGQRGLHPVGQALVRQGVLSSRSLFAMEARVERSDVRLPDALRMTLNVPQDEIALAEAAVAGTQVIDPRAHPPDPALIARAGEGRCARDRVLPWRRSGGTTVVLTSQPDVARRIAPDLQARLGPISLAVTTEDALLTALQRSRGPEMAAQAEKRVPARLSCRGWKPGLAAWTVLALAALLLTGLILAPVPTFTALTACAITTLVLTTGLKLTALIIALRRGARPAPPPGVRPLRQPIVSLLVPLFEEREISGHLLERLQKIQYPRELLDIWLVLEAEDSVTRATISATQLPPWIRTVTVPPGTLKTKPRALNYALDFTRGSIIGIYDAEDAPAPDQITRVVTRFANAPSHVACLQGVLDYYNAGSNWLSRCFTLEYATWFRVMLPGLQRLGLVMPLGGTTLFLRRPVIEELHGWDAHNVTEDADLGVRLARAGYRTELIDTVTEEEANCRPWPWVKQRSRWLKGYGLTYGVHMARPLQLWRDLGAWRFFGLQVLFLGTICQVLLAPVLWSFWAFPLGLPHPLAGAAPSAVLWGCGLLFIACELLTIGTAMVAAGRAGKSWLAPWAITGHFYFPLASIAAYKGLVELMTRPFFWDKTEHGVDLGQTAPGARR